MGLGLGRQMLAAAEAELDPDLASSKIERSAEIELQARQGLLDQRRPTGAQAPPLDPAIGAQRL